MTFMRSTNDTDQSGTSAEARVGALASKALSVLAARRTAVRQLSEEHICALEHAVCGPGPEQRDAVIEGMRAEGIGIAEICDHYIPEVARRLGDQWCNDTLSFADVTIGSARLQSLLRDIAEDEHPSHGRRDSEVVVMVLAGEHHTLGAMVLTGQLRRMGVSVRLALGTSTPEVCKIVEGAAFDAILISVAAREDLDMVRETVALLRQSTRGGVPLIVGGGVLDMGFDMAKAATGADYATNDLRSALKFSGCEIQAGPS
ncbi:B12 binding protein [Palleronia aestuarii]|uniref:B12 binding protein n=1 Tax=Palleronia aestuarii TaxID=568105 RepID=A0A2W7NEI6_9RHOB|nr:cobalamin B12-binding domain-containing protein [Palleronia aestuarii]PZX16537.1 B12 binding protein [Palleronia aestuarii]